MYVFGFGVVLVWIVFLVLSKIGSNCSQKFSKSVLYSTEVNYRQEYLQSWNSWKKWPSLVESAPISWPRQMDLHTGMDLYGELQSLNSQQCVPDERFTPPDCLESQEQCLDSLRLWKLKSIHSQLSGTQILELGVCPAGEIGRGR